MYVIQVRADAEQKDEIPCPPTYPPPLEVPQPNARRYGHSSATDYPTHGTAHPPDGRLLREYFPNQAVMSIERDDFSSLRKRATIPYDANIVDLTSSPFSRPLSRRTSPASQPNGQYSTAVHNPHDQVAPRPFSGSFFHNPSMQHRDPPVAPPYPAPHIPNQPMYHSRVADGRPHGPQHGQQPPSGTSYTSSYPMPQLGCSQQDQLNDHSRTLRLLPSQSSQPSLPVHGAPAPVQLAPRDIGFSANGLRAYPMQMVSHQHPYAPADGDVAPAQYYDRPNPL